MKEKRYKEIMGHLGMPNSTSLFLALQQVENEVTQEIKSKEKDRILSIVDSCFHAYASSYRAEAKEYAEDILNSA